MTAPIVGIPEIAKHLGAPLQLVSDWYDHDELPRPRCFVNAGPAWAKETIDEWYIRVGHRLMPTRTTENAR